MPRIWNSSVSTSNGQGGNLPSRSHLVKQTSNFKWDWKEVIARKITTTLWSNFRISISDEAPEELKLFFKNFLKETDFLAYFRKMEMILSKYGANIFGCEKVENEGMDMWFWDIAVPHAYQASARLGQEFKSEYLLGFYRDLTGDNFSNTSQLRVLQFWNRYYRESIPLGNNSVGDKVFMSWVTMTAPKYLKELSTTTGEKRHSTPGVLTWTQMINREKYISWDYAASSMSTANFDTKTMSTWSSAEIGPYTYLTDWFPVQKFEPIINYFGTFMGWEMATNTTKMVGAIDMSSLREFQGQLDNMKMNGALPAEEIQLLQSFIYTTRAGEAEVKQYTSEFKGNDWTIFFNAFMNFIFRMCQIGEFDGAAAPSVRETETKTKQQDNNFATFIRDRKSFRERQIKNQILQRRVEAFFGPEKANEFYDMYDMIIESNILQDKLDEIDRLNNLVAMNAIDKDTLLNTAHKDKSPLEVQRIKKNIEKENKDSWEQQERLDEEIDKREMRDKVKND